MALEVSDETYTSIPLPESPSAIFDQAFDILKDNLVPILLIVAVLYVPLESLRAFISVKSLLPMMSEVTRLGDKAGIHKTLVAWIGSLLLGEPRHTHTPGLVSLIIPFVVSAPIAIAISDIFSGKQIDVISSYYRVGVRAFSVIGSTVIAGLACFAVWSCITLFLVIFLGFIVGLITMAVGSNMQGGIAAVLGTSYLLICLIVPFLITAAFFGKTFAFAVPAAVIEHMGSLNAIWRSQQLAACVRLRVIMLVFTILPLVLISIQFAIIYALQSLTAFLHIGSLMSFLLNAAASLLITCLVQAYWMVFIARLYYDCRIRRECIDIRLMAALGGSN